MKNTMIVAGLLLISFIFTPLTVAQDDHSIVDVFDRDGRFTTMAAALEVAGLVEEFSEGTWTIFAPTNEAFARIGITAGNVRYKYSPEELRFILLYHALPRFASMADAKSMIGDVTMANGRTAGWKWYDDSLFLNDDSRVIVPNVLASNGIVHGVDNVVQGPWPKEDSNEPAPPPQEAVVDTTKMSIVEVLNSEPRFRVTARAVEFAGLTDLLSSGQWTFFAPNNPAWRRVGIRANNINRTYTRAFMRDFLLYHIVPDHMSLAKAKTMLGDIVMANGERAGIKILGRRLWVNDDSRVVISDIHTNNGVIHGVRDVILPPWPRVSSAEQVSSMPSEE